MASSSRSGQGTARPAGGGSAQARAAAMLAARQQGKDYDYPALKVDFAALDDFSPALAASVKQAADSMMTSLQRSDLQKALSLALNDGKLPSRQDGLSLTELQYLNEVQSGLWKTVQGRARSGFTSNSAVLAAAQMVRARPTPTGHVVQSNLKVANFIVNIAKATALARLKGDQDFEKYLMLGRNLNDEIVVLSIQIGGKQGGVISPVPGTIAIVHVHYRGMGQPPHAGDSDAAKKRMVSFVIGASGAVWEVGLPAGVVSIRSVEKGGSGVSYGSWEKFQEDPSAYKLYKVN